MTTYYALHCNYSLILTPNRYSDISNELHFENLKNMYKINPSIIRSKYLTPWIWDLLRNWQSLKKLSPFSKNRKIHYRAHNSLPVIPTLSQMNPDRNITCCSFNINFTTFFSPMLWSFYRNFLIILCMKFSFFPVSAIHISYFNRLEFNTVTVICKATDY